MVELGSLHGDTGLTVENGVVRLTRTNTAIPTHGGTTIASGQISAVSDGVGGSIYVLGDRVGLLSANINASGQVGGGTVLIGGDYRGLGSVPNAQFTTVDALTSIRADALTSGNGGKVVLWADNITRFSGAITAKGGSISGDGGFVEVSGKESLAHTGTADLSAVNGSTGTLLLDPANITIVASGGVNDAQLSDIKFSLLMAVLGVTPFLSRL